MTSPTLIDPAVPLPIHRTATARRTKTSPARFALPLGLLFITLLTTTAVGMRYMYDFRLGVPPLSSDIDVLPYRWALANLRSLPTGLPFSLTLIGILLTHEFGHYFACRYFGVSATLPYMLPAPSLSGTFGAVIRLRSRVTSRTALVVIGASGPVAGFVVTACTLTLGLSASTYTDQVQHARVGVPLILPLLRALHPLGQPPHSYLANPHPILIASWMGLLITALNLIPAGQLDGGHIAYAISPTFHRWSSRVVVATLFTLGIVQWAGWLLWGAILLAPAMRHPRVSDRSPLSPAARVLIPICLAVLLLCGTIQPFTGYSLLDILHALPSRSH